MIGYTFIKLLPILLLTVGGYLLSRIYKLNLDTLVKIITDFLMPMLIFYSLYSSDLEGNLVLNLAGATTLIVVLLTGSAYVYARMARIDARTFMPAVIFMNSGFLGIPLMKLWGGFPAMNLIVIYDQIQTIYIFTLGILIITGGLSTKSLSAVVRSPILWAVFGGFFFRFLNIPLPEPLLTTMDFGGNAAPPLAAVALGISLHETRFHIDKHVIAGLLLRFGGGLLFGFLASELFGLTGLSRTVVIVASSLPSAVFTSVLPLRSGVRSDFAGTMVVLSTILAVLTIPLTFYLTV
ncbi:MAG: AEC family transporter [Spirochaetales bacterium]|jgi:predicted permease|nr:AEC family transporter [Spirochaetales bacterium]